MRARGGIDELPCNPQLRTALSHAAFEHIAHAQLTSDPPDVDWLALVGERRIPRDDEQRLEARQRGNDVFDEAVGKIVLRGIAAQIREGQHRDRRFGRKLECWLRREQRGWNLRRTFSRETLVVAEGDPPNPYRFGNVFQLLRSEVLADEFDLAVDLPVGVVGDADAAGFGQSLKPHGDIDAVAEYIVLVDHDVADMHADPKLDFGLRRFAAILCGHHTLDLDGAARRIYRTCELRQYGVAGRLHDTPAMGFDSRRDEGLSDGLEPDQDGFLVGAHQAAVVLDRRRQHRRPSSFHALAAQRTSNIAFTLVAISKHFGSQRSIFPQADVCRREAVTCRRAISASSRAARSQLTSTIGKRTSALSIRPVRASQYLAGAGLGSANSNRVRADTLSQRSRASSVRPSLKSLAIAANVDVSIWADNRMAPSAPSLNASKYRASSPVRMRKPAGRRRNMSIDCARSAPQSFMPTMLGWPASSSSVSVSSATDER